MNYEIETIWHSFHKELRRFVTSKVGNITDADDILQNAFVKIIENSDKVNKANNLKQYLYGIVKNATADHFRKKKPTSVEISEQIKFTEQEEQSLNTTISNCCIRPFIEQLPAKYKEALLIAEFENVSQKELAKQLGISYSGAKSRVQRAREKLKQTILNCCALESDVYGNLMAPEKDNCNCP